MITRRGIGFVISAVAVFFLASATRVGWAHLAGALLWGVVLLSFAVPWLTVAGLSATRRLNVNAKGGLSGPVERDGVISELTLCGRGRLPRVMATAQYSVTCEGQPPRFHKFFFSSVPAKGRRAMTRDFVFDRRGRAELGRVMVECSAPFGLFRRRKTSGTIQSLLVYPRWHAMTRLGLLEDVSGDADGNARSRSGAEISGTRRYVAGAPLRHIHWRNSARSARLLVKEFDAWGEQSYVFAFLAGHGQASGDAFDDAVRLAASAAQPVIAQGGQVFLAVNGQISQAFASWPQIMAQLALLELRADSGAAPVLLAPANARVLGFVLGGSAVSAGFLKDAARRGHAVAAVEFRGYGEAGDGIISSEALRHSGVASVTCEKGKLQAATEALQNGVAARTTPATSPAAMSSRPSETGRTEAKAA